MKSTNRIQLIFLFTLLISFWSCVDDEAKNDVKNVDQIAFLQNSTKIISESFELTTQLSAELTTSCDSFSKNPTTNNLSALKLSLKQVWKAWQKVSFYEFEKAEQIGLKSNLNIYKTDTNQIESNISSGQFNLDQLSMKTAKGFPAIDYLINSSTEHATVSAFINDTNRRKYLQELTKDIEVKVDEVNQDWLINGGAFASNTGTDVGSSTGMIVNALNLHYEKFFRDNKIGIPLGVRSSGIAHPEFCEAVFGNYSVELAIENFNAMSNFYLGIDNSNINGYGLDDYLISVDAADLNTSINNALSTIKLKLNTLTDPLSSQVVNDPNTVQDCYNEIQKLIVLWKVDMPSRMGVLISYQDTDGD